MSNGSMDRTLNVGDIILLAHKFPEDVFPCALIGKICDFTVDEDDYLMYVIQFEDGKKANVYPERVFAKIYLYSNIFKAVLLDVDEDELDFDEEDVKWLEEQEQKQVEAEKEIAEAKEVTRGVSGLPSLVPAIDANKPSPLWGGKTVDYSDWTIDQLLDGLNHYKDHEELPFEDNVDFGGIYAQILNELKKRG